MNTMRPKFVSLTTCFEDLSNELVCEIFEYLDIMEMDRIFSSLNQRYTSLIRRSNLPIKLNFSSITHATYEYYYNQVVLPYRHRTQSLYLTNPCILDRLDFPLFPRLQMLSLENVAQEKLSRILRDLSELRVLSVEVADVVQDLHILYGHILRLPLLQYCRISGEKHFSIAPRRMTSNHNRSGIQQLVIDHQCNINHLVVLSSCLPELCRLSCTKLTGLRSQHLHLRPMVLNKLAHLTLKAKDLSFDQLELVFMHLTHQLEVFHFYTGYQVPYFNAHRWQSFISSTLPKLRRFNLQIKSTKTSPTPIPYVSISPFMSSFWLTRKWYFRYEYQPTYAAFYSIDSNDSSRYKLDSRSYEETAPCQTSRTFPSVTHLIHGGDLSTRMTRLSFPNTINLTITDYVNQSTHSISTLFDRFIPLNKLCQLSIDHPLFSATQLLDLLYFSPYLRILSVHSLSFSKVSLSSIQQTKTFETISEQTQIRKVIVKSSSSQPLVHFFDKLCSRLQQMTVNCDEFFFFRRLDFSNVRTPLLCFFNSARSIDLFHSLDPADDSMRLVGSNVYVWT